MSHGITRINNADQFYSYREVAWHNLGHVSDRPLSFEEAYAEADMASTYYTSPLQTVVVNDDGVSTITIPGQNAAIRHHLSSGQHIPLGVVGDRYKFHHPRDVFSWVDTMVDGGATIETMGDLDEGRRMFLTIKLPNGITVGGTDRTDLYVFATTSFDGSSASQARLTGVRVVCANTWRAAESDVRSNKRKRVSVRHSSELVGNVQKARELLDIGFEMAGELQDLGNQLLSISMRPSDQAEVINQLFPIADHLLYSPMAMLTRGDKKTITSGLNKRAAVTNLVNTSPTLAPEQRGTAWGLFNAVTEWVDHFAPVKGEDAAIRRAERQLLGEAESLKQQALDLLLV